jgi:hypothetical protein
VFSLADTGQLALLRYFLNGIVFNGKPQASVLLYSGRWQLFIRKRFSLQFRIKFEAANQS